MRLLAAGLAVAAVTLGVASAGTARELLPDLRQEVPYKVGVTRESAGGRTVHRLVFASAVSNVGEGPLVVEGARATVETPAMAARQVVVRSDATTRNYAGAGRLRYVVAPDHEHWHLLPFERYELHRADGGPPLARDAKTGFCLGDRYRLPELLRARPRQAAFRTSCGRDAPRLRRIREGISVGYGDDYKPSLEGQYLPLDGLPAGRYVLVHRVNAERRLRELRLDNDVSSALIELTVSNGEPSVRVLARCLGSAKCSR